MQYLDFACGKSHTDNEIDESQAAVGLENVAQLLDDGRSAGFSEGYPQSTISTKEWREEEHSQGGLTEAYPTLESSSESSQSESAEAAHDMSSHHYGSVSDKIGEACACWLTRWAVDILQLETQDQNLTAPHHDTRSRSKSLSSFDPKTALSVSFASRLKAVDPPAIFRVGGLSAKWVFAIVSADTLFIKGEKQRYNLARTIVELRRQVGVLEHEERVWKEMFEHGIYYNNMVSPLLSTSPLL